MESREVELQAAGKFDRYVRSAGPRGLYTDFFLCTRASVRPHSFDRPCDPVGRRASIQKWHAGIRNSRKKRSRTTDISQQPIISRRERRIPWKRRTRCPAERIERAQGQRKVRISLSFSLSPYMFLSGPAADAMTFRHLTYKQIG